MTVKWSKKMAIECLQELRNPFESKKEGGKPGFNVLPNLAEKVQELVLKNKGVK